MNAIREVFVRLIYYPINHYHYHYHLVVFVSGHPSCHIQGIHILGNLGNFVYIIYSFETLMEFIIVPATMG